jgi:peptidoglycan/xylan/chitin deacetylase (PgdA/CDA1 family)
VSSAGHQIGNHSYSHPRLTFQPGETIEREFSQAQQIIEAETGVAPMLMRAPYGFRWFGFSEMQWKLGLLGVMWTVIGFDWRWPAEKIAQHIVKGATPGGILCLHDGRAVDERPDIGQTLRAVELIVPQLREAGYAFETVGEILRA